jgi:hypothetical protein
MRLAQLLQSNLQLVNKIVPRFGSPSLLEVSAYSRPASQELVTYAPAGDGGRKRLDELDDGSPIGQQSLVQIPFHGTFAF